MTQAEKITLDCLSIRILGRNVNPDPSMAWVSSASDEEIADWQNPDPEGEKLLYQRSLVRKSVESFTQHELEELTGVRHYVPPLEEDLTDVRRLPIERFTLQQVRRSGRRVLTRCAFHDDSHPSCVLYPEGRGFYCFSCGAGGNSIDWAKQEFGLTFQQAVEFLRKYL